MNKPNDGADVEAELQSLVRAEAIAGEQAQLATATPRSPLPIEVTTFPKRGTPVPTLSPPVQLVNVVPSATPPSPAPWPAHDATRSPSGAAPPTFFDGPSPVAAQSGARAQSPLAATSLSGAASLTGAPSPSAPRSTSSATPPSAAPSLTGAPSPSAPRSTAATPPFDAPSPDTEELHAGEPAPGTRIHHYEVIKLIGRGGMGSVYLGRDTRLGRKVAIKFLHTQSAELTKRFILEARTTAACSHENIVVIYEVDAWGNAPFMVLEYLQGQPLTKLIPEGKLPPSRAVELMVPVVKALAYAHSQGVVHRDLKPDNVFVTDSGLTKVLDFGIAKVLQSDEKAPDAASRPRAPKASLEDEDHGELTQHGAMMGTLPFMAPEQWGIGVPIDHRADLWAVGIMLYRMLSGQHPLAPLTGQQLMVTGILSTPMPKLETVAPEVPKALAEAVDKCLLKPKELRWADAVSLLRALEPFLPGRFTRELTLDESPYAGLSSFQEADADRFFGRQLEVAAMVNKLRERPAVAVVGPSGAGKSSFVRAGVVPALKRSGDWESLVMRPGRNPLAALASLIAPMLGSSDSVAADLHAQTTLAERLTTEPGLVGAVLRARARREKKNLLLFVDQFEELYTLVSNPAERWAFTSCLTAVADDVTSPIRLVLSVRSDFLGRVPEDPSFMAELSQGLVFLNAPGTEGLREALVQPAEMAGYTFETPNIVADMISHLSSTQGALPLLQFAAQKLWENRDPNAKRLTRLGYEAIGGVAGALASHADAVLAKLRPQALPLVRAMLLRLVTPERTRAIVSMAELHEVTHHAAESQGLVDELVAARLLVVQTGAGVATVEIVHESLIHAWPTLRRWLEESGEDSAFLEQVRVASKQWQQQSRDPHLLWRGELADEAARFRRRFRGTLSDSQVVFLDSTIALAARAVRRRRTAVASALAVLTAGLLAAGFSLVQIQRAKNEADEQKTIAQAAEAQARANQLQAEDRKRALDAAKKELEQQNEALKQQTAALTEAVNAANTAREQAVESESKAKMSAEEAAAAREHTEESKRRVEQAMSKVEALRREESARAKRLEQQLGSPVIDELK